MRYVKGEMLDMRKGADMAEDPILISYGVIEQKFVTDDFLTNSSDRFIGGYYPNLDTLNWKDENIRREFEEHPELWF